jgi:hypothetical protein
VRVLAAALSLALAGCIFAPNLGDGAIGCGAGNACPPGQGCGDDGKCHQGLIIENDAGVGCVRQTCAELGRNCGPAPDGCDGTLNCGSCTAPETCGGGGTPGLCACRPKSCTELGKDCGAVDNGCGATVSCGSCAPPNTCGGGRADNVCGCTPKTCAGEGKDCGTMPDGCGGPTLDCSQGKSCPAGQTCGGGGMNKCGTGSCTPVTCDSLKLNCGDISNGCSGTIHCGDCTLPETCGGGGVENVCGCKPTTCDALGKHCGMASDGCGHMLDCGSCTAPETCGGGIDPSSCGCTRLTCVGKNCGKMPDGCGGVIKCGGACGANKVCVDNVCVDKNGGRCIAKNKCDPIQCGIVSNGCGDVLTCPPCANGRTCVNNVCQ